MVTSVTIPSSVTSIGNDAFSGCSSLTSVNIPESVTSIGSYAFYFCSLTSVNIAEGVTSICSDAFDSCYSLTAVHITDLAAWFNISFDNYRSNPLYYAHRLYLNDEEITELVIPDEVKSIGNYAFYGCNNLNSITIPNNATSIGRSTFEGCNGVTSVIIGSGVTSIGKYAFRCCSSLTDVYCYAEEIPETDYFAFDESPIGSATLHVPEGSVEAYSNTYPWKNFGSIVAIEVLATSISLNQTTLTLNAANPTAQLTATVMPDNATNKNVKWSSSNTSVASVSGTGVVRAIEYGTATITATTTDGTNLSDTCQVTVALDISTQVMSSAIYGDYMNMDYDTFLQDLNNNISFFLPTDRALCYYYDPVSMKSRTPRNIMFSFVKNSSFPVKLQFYNYYCPYNMNNGTIGTIGASIPGSSYTQDEVVNRLKDILESHTIVHDDSNPIDSQQEYYLSQNGCPIKVIRDEGNNIISVKGGFQLENERLGIDPDVAAPGVLSCPIDSMYMMDNGHTYVLNAPLVPTYRSVYSIFTNDYDLYMDAAGETPYSQFYDLCTADGYETEIIGCGLVDRNLSPQQRRAALKQYMIFISDCGLDYNVRFFDNDHHYTIFVPTNEAVQAAIEAGLPTWEDIREDFRTHCKPEIDEETGEPRLDPAGEIVYTDSLQTHEDSVRIAAKITYLTKFVRNHFVENSVFADKTVLAHQEMDIARNDWEETEQFPKIHVDRVANGSGGTDLRVCDDVTWKENGGSMEGEVMPFVTVGEKNVLARDISCNSSPHLTQMRNIVIQSSSATVIHSIPGCLNHTKLIDGRHDKTWEAIIAIPATDISLNQTTLTFNAANQTAQLTATVMPDNATNKNVTWSSDNPSVATVISGGLVTAIANGEATITATTTDGTNLSATCQVTVAIPVLPTGISVSPDTLTLNVANQTATLTASVTPSNATDYYIKWSSSNPEVAAVVTIDGDGIVIPGANGTATIRARVYKSNGTPTNLSATCKVRVAIYNINFRDPKVKQICVSEDTQWDTNGDGELSMGEAAAVQDLKTYFKNKSEITSFDELKYFTRLTKIYSSAFQGCSSLTSIAIPKNVTSIGSNAFSECSKLEAVKITNLTAWCKISYGNDTAQPLNLAHHLYLNGHKITDLDIPEEITKINNHAFRGCTDLITVKIHNGVTSIGNNVFNGCTGLTVIYCNREEPPTVSSTTFRGITPSEIILVVPDEAVEPYKAHDIWKQFRIETPTSIREMEDGRNKMEDGSIYNLAGQRLSKMQKGINIIGGKKVAVK